jgi:2,3-bisphosphoglycerate-dependent phosphoglycerate mutase
MSQNSKRAAAKQLAQEPTRRGRRVAGLVRHGHFDRPDYTASAHRVLPLSDLGREQAFAGADPILDLCREHDLELDSTIEASQLLRAWETATVLAAALSQQESRAFDVEERDELIERGLGSCANLRFDEIEAAIARDPRLAPLPVGWRRIPEFRLPVQGAESLMQAGARTAMRIATSIDSIREDDPRDLVRLFVAHSGCLRHAAVNLGALDMRSVSRLSMNFCQIILIEKTPTGEWVQLAGQWKKHLPAS